MKMVDSKGMLGILLGFVSLSVSVWSAGKLDDFCGTMIILCLDGILLLSIA